jgi:Rhs element Vgr protein
MDIIEIAGVGKRFNGKALVSGIRHRIDQHGWETDVQFGLSAERFAERQGIVDTPAAGLLPSVNGLQIGRVSDFEEDPNKEFRVKVILPGIDIDKDKGAVWARLATPDAGKDRGYFFRPEKGDEVVVGFFNDDPRQAVILGAMYSSKNTPPEAVSQLEEKNPKKGIFTKNGATILLDDENEAIQITDKHENSITMNKDGIEIKSAKDLKIAAKGKIEIKGEKDMTIEARGKIEIKGSEVDIK